MLPSCGSSPTAPSSTNSGSNISSSAVVALANISGTVAGRTISVAVAAGGPLGVVGGAAELQTSLGIFLLARTAQDAVSVLTAVCTHEGCTVMDFAAPQFVCVCHGSRFTTSGAVVLGPATSALKSFPATFVNGTVTFSA